MLKFQIVIILFFSVNVFADQLVSCNDGDTCRIKTSDGIFKVRLAGIDAPETGQSGWEASRDYLVKKLKDQDLKLECNGKSYDRKVCRIFVNGTDINGEMINAGMAWDYPQYSEKRYIKFEVSARQKKLGLWAGSALKSPFCYRHETASGCSKNKNQFQP